MERRKYIQSGKKERVVVGRSLIEIVFSWSVKDVRNHNLHKNQVQQIPKTFSSTAEYLTSFTIPLIEETHTDMSSSMDALDRSPCRRIRSFKKLKNYSTRKDFSYRVVLKHRTLEDRCRSFYEPETGDLIAITSIRPRKARDLEKYSVVAYVQSVNEESTIIFALLSRPIPTDEYAHVSEKSPNLFVTYLINMTTNVRIWDALTSGPKERNMKVLERVLQTQSMVAETCNLCEEDSSESDMAFRKRTGWSDLNESQRNAVLSCIGSRKSSHESTMKLVWGPPGTGKTSTVGFMLQSLLGMRCRTLTCAPTNVAILEVTERLVKRVALMSMGNRRGYSLGDVVLFGNGERMKIDERDELRDVFLNHRIKVLLPCFVEKTGWRDCLLSVISLLDDPLTLYDSYLQEEAGKRMLGDDSESDGKQDGRQRKIKDDMRFDQLVAQLSFCIHTLCRHLPGSVISVQLAKTMFDADDALYDLQELLHGVSPKELKYIFADDYVGEDARTSKARDSRMRSLPLLRSLPATFNVPFYGEINQTEVREFLLSNACLVFCTVSSSAKLHDNGVSPWELLIIDEAAQLKECESTIPLQLPGIRHAVLIGDERQLPAMVKSKICEEADFGRSLFERLASLGHKKHLLNVQHRMHPSISLFPNQEFYEGKILDGKNVTLSHNKRFLQGKMFDSYSFINVRHGSEAVGNNHSSKNMVEVSVVSEIVARLYKEMKTSKERVRVGVISPYNAQVYAIKERLGNSYSSDPQSNFSVSVRSVDGFQGGEEDVVIISTVRSNFSGSLGFLSNCQRTNVALTRARNCLWIVGNGSTLSRRHSVWKKLVHDAKERRCFHEADDDKGLARAMLASLVELNQIRASHDLAALLFQDSKWTVRFDEAFWTTVARVRDNECCKEVLLTLQKLSGGWRSGESAQIVEHYSVKGRFLVWGVDIERKISVHTQILKIYRVLDSGKVPGLSRQLYEKYSSYSPEKLKRCNHRRMDGDLVVPMTWPADPIKDGEDPLSFLLQPLASLSLKNEPATSD